MKNRNKLKVCALALGSFGFLACLSGGQANPSYTNLTKDTTFLVTLKGTEKSLGKEGAKKVRDEYVSSLRNTIGYNFRVDYTYEAINVLKISANSSLESALRANNLVKGVSIDQIYRFGDMFNGQRTDEEINEGYVPLATTTEGNAEEGEAKNQSKETMNVPTTNNGGAGSFVAILDSGFFIDHHAFTNLTGEAASKVRFKYDDLNKVANSLTAKRKKVLTNVTDTYTGELADGSLYYNLKVPFYYDYGGSSENTSNDYDAYSPWSNHGTHVASITGANGTYKGIAPNAQLALMKVFYESIPQDSSSAGGVYAKDTDILEALNDCVLLGIDTLNMSLGSDLDDFSNKSGSMEVIDKLTADGVSCNISAGNGGKSLYSSMGLYKDWATDQVDTGILGSYANSQKANIIASSTNPTQYYESALKFNVDGKETIVGYSDQVDYTDGSDGIETEADQKLLSMLGDNVELATAGSPDTNGNYYGTSADYAKVTAQDSNFYKGKVAVVDRGSTSFVDKAQAAQDAGCVGLIVINNDPTAIEFSFGMSWASGDGNFNVPEIPVVFVLYRDRNTILNSLTGGMNSKGETSDDYEADKYVKSELLCTYGKAGLISKTEADNPDKNKLSDFSSDGANTDLTLSPTLSAPGSSIRGATLGKANSQGKVEAENKDPDYFEYLSGTSMAAPNYTGFVALLIGEQNFASEKERTAYLKSISMRAMSTADQYATTNTKYGAIKTRKDTTTGDNPKEVTIYEPVKDETVEETSEYSPRKQGAGVVNAGQAINSKVYLEGLTVNQDGTFSTKGNGFAKVELKNNDAIKEGNIKLGFKVHNEGNEAKTYKVTMNVLSSQISSYHNHDNELANYVTTDAKYEGAKVQTAFDKRLEENIDLGNITIEANTTKDFKDFSHTISDSTKEYMKNFENGGFLEGYVTLTPVGSEVSDANPRLSLPYMGFYGDYSKAYATEPFQFEKEDTYSLNGETGVGTGKVYGSDLVDYIGSKNYALDFIKQGSTIAFDSFENYENNDRRISVLKNINNLTNFANTPTIQKDEKSGEYTIYAGGARTDILYLQEFVLRSLKSEKVGIYDSNNRLVRETNVTDNISGSTYLYKSLVTANYISSKILTHRGYAELPLYTEDGAKLPNGTYTLRFDYNLIYGSKQTKEYKLVIDSDAPSLTYKAIFDNNGVKTLRLKFNEIYISEKARVSVNSGLTSFNLTKVSDGYLVDIALNDESFNDDKLFISIEDASYTYANFMINKSETETGVIVSSDKLTQGSTYSYYKKSLNDALANYNVYDQYEIKAKNYNGVDMDLGEYTAVITYGKKLTNSAKVYALNDKGALVLIKNYSLIDSSTIKVTTSAKTIIVKDSGNPTNDFEYSDNAFVNVNTPENGKVYVDKMSGRDGENVTVYAVPDNGFKVQSVVVNGVTIAANSNGSYTFQLQKGDNTVVVTFVAK